MVDYKKTGKYVQTPAQDPTDIYVGKPEEVDYSGKSTRIDDNFTYIASQIGGPEKYHPGVGMTLTASGGGTELDTFNVDTDYVNTLITAVTDTKQPALTPGANIAIEDNVISVVGLDIYLEEYAVATTDTKGLMSAEDKAKLDTIASNANNYTLPAATLSTLGGIIVGDNLTIDNGVLSAVNNEYFPAESGSSTPGLLTGADKDKLDSIFYGATKVVVDSSRNADGYISINNNLALVYHHPDYSTISGTVGAGKFIDGITVDELGHVTAISSRNESGITVNTTSLGNIVTGVSYDTLESTLDIDKGYLGDIQIGVLDSTTTGTSLSSTDHINTVIRKLQNSILANKTDADRELDKRMEFLGDASEEPTEATEGDVYKATSSFTLDGQQVNIGDLIIYRNSSWYVVPSGDKTDTWRPIVINTGAGTTYTIPDTAGGSPFRLQGTGLTNLIWNPGTQTLNIETIGIGPDDAGGHVYTASTGLDENTVVNSQDTLITTFSLKAATSETPGGIKLGRGLEVDPNDDYLVNVIPVGYTAGNGITISTVNGNKVISANFGITSTTVAVGNHTHTFTDILGPASPNNGDVITYDGLNNQWITAQPVLNVYAAGTNVNITDDGNHHFTINSTDTNTNRGILVNTTTAVLPNDLRQINFKAGNGIVLSTETTLQDVLDIKIDSTNCSGEGSHTYGNSAPITITNDIIGLGYDPTTLEVNGSSKLAVKSVSWSQITNPPTIPTVYNSTITIKQGSDTKGTFTLNQNNSSTITLDAGGSGSDISSSVLSDLSDVTYVGTGQDPTPTIGQVLKYSGTNWYNADDNNTEYTAGTGITINSSNAISVDIATSGGLKLVDYTDNNVTTYKLAIDIDNNTVVLDNGHLKVDHAQQTSGYVSKADTTISYTSTSDTSTCIQNNTIYRFTSGSITGITITAFASDFQYATVCFTASSSGTAWTFGTDNLNYRCTGFDCAGGTFTPQAGKEYQVAIDRIGDSTNGYITTGYVLRID